MERDGYDQQANGAMDEFRTFIKQRMQEKHFNGNTLAQQLGLEERGRQIIHDLLNGRRKRPPFLDRAIIPGLYQALASEPGEVSEQFKKLVIQVQCGAWSVEKLLPSAQPPPTGQPPAIPKRAERQDTWQRIRALLEGPNPPTNYGDALRGIFTEIAGAIHTVTPVIRLWGDRGALEAAARPVFERVGQAIGQCCVDHKMAISCTMLHPGTSEYWALIGARDRVSDKPYPSPIYFHFNGSEAPYSSSEGEELFKALRASFPIVEVKYPYPDNQYQNALNAAINYQLSSAHDARLGSLCQCDAVVLLGGGHAARHLAQLVAFIGQQRMRAVGPILFIPIPWVGGTAREVYKAYDAVNGLIEDLALP